jgi:hypothetical protein
MSEQVKERAEARLLEAFTRHAVADNRPAYRQRLRGLRDRDPAAFDRALRHYEDDVLPALAGGDDPVAVWIAYGDWLGRLDGPGRLVEIDARGRARPADAAAADGLVLFIPDDAGAQVLAVRLPAAPAPAQRATYDLLVAGRVELTP